MSLDVVDLRGFYASPLGEVTQRLVSRLVRARWQDYGGLSVLGIGYATPYLADFKEKAQRVLAFMPAAQGVVHWPLEGRSASALVDATMMPLPDSSIDRILAIHSLEIGEHPRDLLEDIWRILTPGGRVIIVAPSRTGLWARVDTTPFGQGHPYSRGQLQDLLQETQFLPVFWGEALYVPPFARRSLLRSAPAFERIAGRFSLPGGGVHVVEASKQLYRPIGLRRAVRRAAPKFAPALEPVGAGCNRDRACPGRSSSPLF
jgi:SAM-dependent methyltransferase